MAFDVLRFLFYSLICSIFFVDFLSISLGIMPRAVTWVPELLSVLILVCLVFQAAATKRFVINVKYVFLFAVFVIEIVAGIILNDVDLGTVFVAIRYYFKYVPLFLFPVVVFVTTKEFKKQLQLLLLFSLLQLPIVIIQYLKFGSEFADNVSGTLVVTGTLAIYLISNISIAVGFYFKNAISIGQLLLITILLFVPTALGEAKASLIFLPVAIIAVVVASGVWRQNRLKLTVLTTGICLLLGSYSLIYSQFQGEFDRLNRAEGVWDFFTSTDPRKGMLNYIYSGKAKKNEQLRLLEEYDSPLASKRAPSIDVKSVRRFDSITLSIEALSQDFTKLMLGVGIGNASISFIDEFSGEYSYLMEWNITTRALTVFLWEIGLLGLIIFILFFLFVAYDSIKLSQRNNIFGCFATGWTGVVAIFIVSLPYTNFILFNILGILFWYFSGIVATKRIEEFSSVVNSDQASTQPLSPGFFGKP